MTVTIAGPRMTMKIVGKMQPTIGKSIFTGALAAASSARWRRSMRSWLDWIWRTLAIGTPSCSACTMAPMKLLTGWESARVRDITQRVPPGATHPHLGQRLAELVDERPIHLLHDLGERGVEAEARLDRDREQVERVRQLERHRHAPPADPAAEPELRRHESEAGAEEGEEQRHDERAGRAARPSSEPENREGDEAEELHADPVGAAQAAGVAGLLELRVGAGDHAAVLAPADPGEPLDHRPHHPLVERLLQLHLFQRLRLDDELGESRLDRVLARTRGDAVGDQEDGGGGQDRDEDREIGHLHYTLMSTMRRMKR